ncbi:Na+/H+ antiporter subunit E [Wolbachia endosymbiont of Ctenocephalides felis wCfeT]|uniref:Na+/H+ antiporter subunit E n=1 Tax=Wolbachia endosymbiont of Ctenocephalides felis wCfeT TaxID=2732593 RepID=UPI001445FB82|nr:Na+/H+ antiporter subunit E [Wolbachia endosymbiont of Ctenocephalides felis wCfeT]
MNFKQEIRFFSLYFLILFALWIILSGYFEPFFILCGISSSILTLFIFRRLVNAEKSLNKILNSKKKLSFWRLIIYIPWLMYQIILSSIYVAKQVLQFKLKLEPIVIQKKCKGHNDRSIALFANSITITPGTLTVNVEKTYLSTICIINKSLESGISEVENQVLKTFK